MTTTRNTLNASVGATMPNTLSKLELVSIEALIGYVAHNRNMHEVFVKKMVLDRFGVNKLDQLSDSSSDEVINFLVDLPSN